MGYLGLIRNGQYQSEAEMLDYANTAFQKSEKLKVLIEDLFEYTKYANADIRLNMTSVSVNELIEQIVSEYTPVIEENDLTCEISLPEEILFAELDPKRIVRACENLLMNAVKYADRPSVIEVALRQSDDGKVQVTFSNACPHIDEKDLENLFDRLYKVDKSRSETGSGLGLAITKGIIDAHGGRVFASQSQGRVHIGFVL
jgi:signal transduction histidine kinase